MFKTLLKFGFHGSIVIPQRELKHLHISYLQLCVRYSSTKDSCMVAWRKDPKEKPKGDLKVVPVTEEVLCKFNVNVNLKCSSIKNSDLQLTSAEIEWPEKTILNGVAAEKRFSQKIAAKNVLRILTEKKVISDTGQPIHITTFYPKKCATNINDLIVFLNTVKSNPRLCNQYLDDSLSLCSRSNSLISLINVRSYSSCCSLINHFPNTTVRSIHNSSSHDDISRSNKIAVKRNAGDENGEIPVPSNNVIMKRKKKDKVGRIKSKKLKTAEVIPVVPDISAIIEKDIAVKTKETEELKGLKIPTDVYTSNREGKKNLAEIKDESDSLHVTASEDNNISITKGELGVIEKKYPHPIGTLHNIYALVAQELKNSIYKLERSYRMVPVQIGKSSKTMWSCTYKVNWPKEAMFSSTMSSKSLAGKQTALKALYWLQMQGKLTMAGAPKLYDPIAVKEMARIPVEVTVDPGIIGDLDILIKYYKENIQPLLVELQSSETELENICNVDEVFPEDEGINNVENLFGTRESTNPITGFSFIETNSEKIAQRNKQLYKRYLQRTASDNKGNEKSEILPITKFKSQILKMVEENKVMVIKGEPGCGKSTQVPQYLMENWEASKKGAHCNIIITQPRRISAISLADWVAYERQEEIGDVVGYQVRLKAVLPKPPGGALLFCSTGILLRRLQNNPGLFGASHVILDEAHERDINTDMLLVLLHRALSLNHDLRLIVMSATINAELFQNYFSGASALYIPGFTYPVNSIFLENFEFRRKIISRTSEHPFIDCDLVVDTIKWINENKPEGAILCFLPGWSEIAKVSRLLSDKVGHSDWVLPLHSRLSNAEQYRIFNVPPPGVRKIILSTNIAETSITINDVKYVIDSGAHKEERLNVNLGVSSLDNRWVSKANVRQRRGRAGRVQPGECFHLYTQKKYDSLDEFPIPELLRVPLEKTVLDLKTYSQDEKAREFLAEMPEPPSAEAVIQAVNELYQLGALDENERLTSLGRRIALFSTHPKLSKALVMAAIFKCVSPMLTITTVLSGDANLFIGGLDNKENIRLTKRLFHPSSDHIAMAWLYQEWEMINEKSSRDVNNYCYARSLRNESLNLTSKLRRLYSDQLCQSRILDDSEDYKELDGRSNKYAGNDELVKAVFYSGTGTLLYMRSWDVKNGRIVKDANVILTEAGRHTILSSESVNHKRTNFPSPFLTYFRQVESTERRIVTVHESSLLSPLSVLLFSEGMCIVKKFVAPPKEEDKWNNHVILKIERNKRDVFLLCDNSVVRKLLDLREITWSMINYFIQKNGVEEDDERYKTICSYHDRLLKMLSSMLYKSGSLIEYDAEGNQYK